MAPVDGVAEKENAGMKKINIIKPAKILINFLKFCLVNIPIFFHFSSPLAEYYFKIFLFFVSNRP